MIKKKCETNFTYEIESLFMIEGDEAILVLPDELKCDEEV